MVHHFLRDAGKLDGCLPAKRSLLLSPPTGAIRMSNVSELELQEEIARRHIALSVIIVRVRSGVPLAVRAMEAGAVAFLESRSL